MTPRRLTGYFCVAAGFVLIMLLGYGVIEPFGTVEGADGIGDLLVSVLLPSVLGPLALFLLGLWLLRGARRR